MVSEPFHRRGRQTETLRITQVAVACLQLVGHWIDQHLSDDSRHLSVPRQECDDGGQIAAGAIAGDDNPQGIDAEGISLIGHPDECCGAIIDCGRKGVFRGQAIVG